MLPTCKVKLQLRSALSFLGAAAELHQNKPITAAANNSLAEVELGIVPCIPSPHPVPDDNGNGSSSGNFVLLVCVLIGLYTRTIPCTRKRGLKLVS